MDGILPEEIQRRHDKKGFPTPFEEWFRGPLLKEVESCIMDGRLTESHYLDRDKVEAFLSGHRQGRYDISRHIWLWLCLSVWFELHERMADRSLAVRLPHRNDEYETGS
jgi:hypothetical protein